MDMRDATPVAVDVHVRKNGVPIPRSIYWAGGRVFFISEVLECIEFPAAQEQEKTRRFAVRIGSRVTYLYNSGKLWYVRPRQTVTSFDPSEFE